MLHSLEEDCFETAWSKEQLKIALDNNHILFLGLFLEQKLAAYISVQCIPSITNLKDGECEIFNIATHTEHRRKGYANILLDYCIDFVKKSEALSVFLDVRVTNHPALELYRKTGFKEVGRRKNYYETNTGYEDAILMQLEL